jgi:hypothetical protein
MTGSINCSRVRGHDRVYDAHRDIALEQRFERPLGDALDGAV